MLFEVRPVESFELDDAHTRPYATLNADGRARSFAFDARTLRALVLPFPRGLDHESVEFVSPDGRYAVLGFSPPDGPRSSAVLDWRSGQLTRWITPSVPELDTRRFVPATLESYAARDGTPIPMFVRQPAQCAAASPPAALPSAVATA